MQERKSIDSFLKSALPRASWEIWHLEGERISRVEFGGRAQSASKKLTNNSPLSVEDQLVAAADEYRTLIATSYAKCAQCLSTTTAEIELFNSAFRDKLLNGSHHYVTRLSWLVIVNAALSRFSSQTFSGSSPISETESHFWTHSLLGIGLGSMALLNVRRWIDHAGRRARLIDRLQALKNEKPNARNFGDLALGDLYWRSSHLPSLSSGPEEALEDTLPHIVFFSGRDGFRSTLFTLSVPLEVISACNTVGWSLLTLTHEISHVFVDGIMGELLQGLDTSAAATRLAKLYNFEKEPDSLFDQVQVLVLLGFVTLERESRQMSAQTELEISEKTILPFIQNHWSVVSEILTHIFDYLYFYGRDSKSYVTSIWSSWDVIPNIEDRINDYLLRCLCAVLVDNMSVSNATDVTIDSVIQHLEDLKTHTKDDQYIAKALDRLKTERKFFKDSLVNRFAFVKLSSSFFYSPDMARDFAKEVPETKGAYSSYKPWTFDPSRKITNPLRFLRRFATDSKPDAHKSLWMLYQLAFAEIGNGN